MSSFNVHKSHVLDSSLPIENRFSHLRSCLNKVANLLGCSRATLVEKINSSIGVNVEKGNSEVDLLNAFEFLLKLRDEQLHKPK
jgi:biotin operon repressor